MSLHDTMTNSFRLKTQTARWNLLQTMSFLTAFRFVGAQLHFQFLKVLVEWIQFVYEMVAKPESKIRNWSRDIDENNNVMSTMRNARQATSTHDRMTSWDCTLTSLGAWLVARMMDATAFPQGTGTVTLSIPLHYVTSLVHNIGRKRQF